MPGQKISNKTKKSLIASIIFCTFLAAFILAYKYGVTVGMGFQKKKNYMDTHLFYKRISKQLNSNMILFIGDSHIRGLCTTCITGNSVNFGVGGDTISGTGKRLLDYLKTMPNIAPRAIVIQTGINDAFRDNKNFKDNYRVMLESIPGEIPVFAHALFPVSIEGNDRDIKNVSISSLNREIRRLCSLKPGCRFVDFNYKLLNENNGLDKKYHAGDGIHLNTFGYNIWISILQSLLRPEE